MKFYIEDYNLTAAQLEARYAEAEQHPGYTRGIHESTAPPNCDYWQWVADILAMEEDELQSDSPYHVPYDDN